MKRRLKKPVKYVLYVVAFIALAGIIYSVEKTLFPVTFNDKDNYEYVSKTIFDDVIPVVNEEEDIRHMAELGVDAIIGNYPDRISKVLAEMA